jgi:glutamyl-tRNA reductase
LIIDLSIPYNVEKAAQDLSNITLVNVDEIIKDQGPNASPTRSRGTKSKKRSSAIILMNFLDWHQMRQHVPVLKAVKHRLQTMHSCTLFINYSASLTPAKFAYPTREEKIQKVINGMALKMRNQINEVATTLKPSMNTSTRVQIKSNAGN